MDEICGYGWGLGTYVTSFRHPPCISGLLKCHESSEIVTKESEDFSWPSYWTQYIKSASDFAGDKRGSIGALSVEK